jgi:hypothetical protein
MAEELRRSRVDLPEGYELFQVGEARQERSLKSARLRDYVLKYQGRDVATFHDFVRSSPRNVVGNVAMGGFSHAKLTRWNVLDGTVRDGGVWDESIGHTARKAARIHAEGLRRLGAGQ